MSQQFNSESTVAQVRGYLVGLQARIIGALEAVEAQAAAAGPGAVRALVGPWPKGPGTPLQGGGRARARPRPAGTRDTNRPGWPTGRARPAPAGACRNPCGFASFR